MGHLYPTNVSSCKATSSWTFASMSNRFNEPLSGLLKISLDEVRRFAPRPVFEMLISIAETELSVERFELITKALKNEVNATTSTMT